MASFKGLVCASLLSVILWFYSSWSSCQIFLSFLVICTIIPKGKRKLPVNFEGFVEPGFEKVAEVFKENLEKKGEKGGAFSVYYKGKPVVDLWGGYADVPAKIKWKEDTLSMYFSCAKGVTAITVAYMVDKGLLDYDTPIAHYWPEFAQNGKEKITLKTYLSHRAGLVIIDEKFTLTMLKEDPEKLGRILAAQKPNWEPGTLHGYHVVTMALYIDQIIRRVDPLKRDLGTYFMDEIAKPFGIDFYIGLPLAENYRCARLNIADFGLIFRVTVAYPRLAWYFYQIFKDYLYGKNLLFQSGKNPSDTQGHNNDPYYRCLPCGSIQGFGTARSLAKLYGILGNGGSPLDGERLLQESTIKILNTPLISGKDRTLLFDSTWGYGVDTTKVGAQGHNSENKPERYIFGHPGAGGQMAYADPHYNLGFAYVTNGFNDIHLLFEPDHRYTRLCDAMYECVHEIEKKA